MAVSWLRRLAGEAPVPVFTITGAGARRPVQLLRADDRVELVASPRHATVLLVAGALPVELLGTALQVHDQLPSPRAVVRWGDDGGWPGPHEHVRADGDLVGTLTAVHRALLVGDRDSAPPLLPGEHPVPWQGVGPYGHGGEGMMGGAPYGRPLPMPPTEGRDGLALDRLPLTLGPHLAGFPPGLQLHVGLQGDVLEEVTLGDNPFTTATETWDGRPLAVAVGAGGATDRLLRLSELLTLAGATALARRAARLATDPDPAAVQTLARRLGRTATLTGMTRGVGTTDLLGEPTDADQRWRRWLTDEDPSTVSPLAVLDALPELLTGCELGEAMTTIATLPVDLEAAARGVEEVAA